MIVLIKSVKKGQAQSGACARERGGYVKKGSNQDARRDGQRRTPAEDHTIIVRSRA